MLEELIANQLLLPLCAVVALVLAVLFFRLGWAIKSFGAGRQAVSLQREVLEAKASVPQLESTVRSREQLISRLQDELQKQTERSAQSRTEHSERERQLKSAQSEVRHLTHELSAIKGKSVASSDIDIDGVDDRGDAGHEKSSPLAEKLRTTEALYDKLKVSLIERSQRIEILESLLKEGEDSGKSGEPALLTNDEIEALQRQLEQRNRTISELNVQVSQLRQEKEMVEELAQKRSKSNRTLKDSRTDVETKKRDLEQALEAHQKTISDREVSIRRLLSDLQTTKNKLQSSVDEARDLTRESATRAEALAEAEEARRSLESAMAEREERLRNVDAELAAANSDVIRMKDALDSMERRIRMEQVLPDGTALEHPVVAEKAEMTEEDGPTLGKRIEDLQNELHVPQQDLEPNQDRSHELLELTSEQPVADAMLVIAQGSPVRVLHRG